MANINVRIKRLNSGSTWDQLFPETTVDQIKLNQAGDPLSAFSQNILEAANPTATSFVKVATNGDVTFRTSAQLIGDIGAAPATHNHIQSQVVNLITDLGNKADLEASGVNAGKIPAAQIPDYLFSGMKFANTAGDSTANDSLEELFADIDDAFGSSTNLQREGAYFIASQNFQLTFGTGHALLAPGDEGETASGLWIEAGDWITYIGYNGTTSKHEWAIVNNTYRNAEIGVTGVVQLSEATATTRAALNNISSGLRVMDEAAVRKVMKDIFYTTDETGISGAATGDLAFVSASF